MEPKRRGLMLVLSSPSGAGKTTIARKLLDAEPGVEMSISCTTRKQRNGEVEGRDYHFIDRETFAGMRDRGEFLEWAVVFDNYYGTPRKPVEETLAAGRDVLFDVDWQGAQSLRDDSPDDVVTVFILPPSAKALVQRLTERAQDSPEVVAARMRGASNEIQHWGEYDYVVINHDLDQALAAVRAILAAERLRCTRLTGLKDFVAGLLHARFDQRVHEAGEPGLARRGGFGARGIRGRLGIRYAGNAISNGNHFIAPSQQQIVSEPGQSVSDYCIAT